MNHSSPSFRRNIFDRPMFSSIPPYTKTSRKVISRVTNKKFDNPLGKDLDVHPTGLFDATLRFIDLLHPLWQRVSPWNRLHILTSVAIQRW